MKKFLTLIVFAIAFGFLEAIIVIYLRKLFGYEGGFKLGGYRTLLNLGAIAIISPASALISDANLVALERLREASTLIILFSVALLSAKNFRQWFGAFLVAFSLRDIFYYVFLEVFLAWPKSLFDLDIYFLLPYVWVGPVVTPLVVFFFLLVFGAYIYLKRD